MPFEKGNKLGEKSRKFEQLVERCLIQEDYRRLREGIESMLDLAATGERWALEMVRDTLDGKPKQTVNLDLGVTQEERVSGFTAFLAEATGQQEDGVVAGISQERPMVSAEIPVTAH